MRLPFLILTPACVVLGLATAIWTVGTVNWFHFVLVLIGAVSAHISVNAFNEYFDFKSGLDEKTRRTPFSGGSGRLQQSPELEKPALYMAWFFLGLVTAVGIYFACAKLNNAENFIVKSSSLIIFLIPGNILSLFSAILAISCCT